MTFPGHFFCLNSTFRFNLQTASSTPISKGNQRKPPRLLKQALHRIDRTLTSFFQRVAQAFKTHTAH